MARVRAAYGGGNRILDKLRAVELQDIASTVEVLDLHAGETTHAPETPYDWVVFPIDAVLSVITTLESGTTAEVGAIGNEGASGVEIAFGAPVLRTTICQVSGRVARMRTHAFIAAIDRNNGLGALIRATEKARTFALEQMIACNSVHDIEQRCARWLLTLSDRVSREEYSLTHNFLSIMLGVRRASVSNAAKTLHAAGAIEYQRGCVRIVSRRLLESRACECYGATARAFDAALSTWFTVARRKRSPRTRTLGS